MVAGLVLGGRLRRRRRRLPQGGRHADRDRGAGLVEKRDYVEGFVLVSGLVIVRVRVKGGW